MELTTDQLITISVEATLGKEPTIFGKEADEYRKSVAETLALCKEKGWVMEIPSEWAIRLDGEKK
jgi:hypothetical protein